MGSIPLENLSDPSLPSLLLFCTCSFPLPLLLSSSLSVHFSVVIISPIFTSFLLPQPLFAFSWIHLIGCRLALLRSCRHLWRSRSHLDTDPRLPRRTPPLLRAALENGQEITRAPYCLNSILLSRALSLIFTLVHRRLQRRFRQLHT